MIWRGLARGIRNGAIFFAGLIGPRWGLVCEAELARRTAAEPAPKDGSPQAQASFRHVLRLLEAMGATTILVFPPVASLRKFHLVPDEERRHLVLDYSDFHRYPELCQTGFRLDSHHLNTEGAMIFTRLVVDEFLAAGAAQP